MKNANVKTEPDRMKRKTLNTKIEPDQDNWLRNHSVTLAQSNAGEGRTKAEHVRKALDEYIERMGKK
jgi:hypothetical protein